MGLLDTTDRTYVRPERLSATDSFMAILFSLIIADGIITDDELQDMHRSLQRTCFLKGMTRKEFDSTLERLRILFKNEGPEEFLTLACSSLPEDLRDGAYILASDLAYSDGSCTEDELIILSKISHQLRMNEQLVKATQQIISLKNSI